MDSSPDRTPVEDDSRTIRAREPRSVPPLSLVLGYGPMLPVLLGAGLAWTLRGATGEIAVSLTLLWACAILLFLSGVRRGLSFRTEGGARPAQIATVLGLFLLGLGALAAAWLGAQLAALALLILGYGAVAVLDPIAARRGEAPLFFARLRPYQMPIAVIGLAALVAYRLSA